MKRTDILERKEEILQWISENLPKAEIMRRLNCSDRTLNSYLQQIGVEYKGNQSRKGMSRSIGSGEKKTFEELSKSSTITSHRLRLRILEEGIKEHKCENCQLTEWMGVPIPLQLHHIDGNHYNNSLENLQLLCPNCHSLTENFSCKKPKDLEA